MPGRRSATAQIATKPKAKNRKLKRGLNALAIAEQQNPIQSKIRTNRLGEIEEGVRKRTRGVGHEPVDLEDGSRNAKRRKDSSGHHFQDGAEVGSDSDGNEWVVGQVKSDDDSDLDSDEAMGESDEERFKAFTFRGSTAQSNRKSNKNSGKLGSEENELHQHQDSEDSLGDDAIDLAKVLDIEDDDLGDGSGTGSRNNGDEARFGDQDSDVDTESSMDNGDSILSISDNENDDSDPAKLALLQTLVSNMDSKKSNELTNRRIIKDAHESTVASEFGLSSARKLTVADLIPSITDPRLKKSLKLLADNETSSSSRRGGISKKLDVPLARRQQDRLDRAAAYAKSKDTLDRWIDTVKHNRRAEHLSFPLQDRDAIAASGKQRLLHTTQTQPLGGLETTIQNILQDSGLAPTKRSSEDQPQAFEDLPTNSLSLEEVQVRRAELRRARDLLFREETRAKRIKKIKSKSYRRVHRKERERKTLAVAGVDGSESEQERNDRRRAEERMGARHRESRWARGVKESKRAAWDEDTRSGVTEMARRGEELRRRIDGTNSTLHQNESSSSEIDSDSGDKAEDVLQTMIRESHSHLNKLDGNDGEPGHKILGTKSDISSLKFMKNAEALRKARNDEDLEKLRRELAGEGSPSEGDTEGVGRKSYGPIGNLAASRKDIIRREQRSEFEEKSGSDTDGESFQGFAEKNEQEIIVDGTMSKKANVSFQRAEAVKNESSNGGFNKKLGLENNENPWLSAKKLRNTSRKTGGSHAATIISNNLTADVSNSHKKIPISRSLVRSSIPDKDMKGEQGTGTSSFAQDSQSDNEDDGVNRLPFVMRNQDLVRKAFAGDEVVAYFEKEKQEIMHDEDEKLIDNNLPGWGSWTGAGISKKKEKSNRDKVVVKVEGVPKEERQDAKLARVIINEKRVKKVHDAKTPQSPVANEQRIQNVKYLASSLPHPFETKQQYERSLRLPVGPEWTTKETFQSATKPRILMKQGIITPMKVPMM